MNFYAILPYAMAIGRTPVKASAGGFVFAGPLSNEIEIGEPDLFPVAFIGWVAVIGLMMLAARVKIKYDNH